MKQFLRLCALVFLITSSAFFLYPKLLDATKKSRFISSKHFGPPKGHITARSYNSKHPQSSSFIQDKPFQSQMMKSYPLFTSEDTLAKEVFYPETFVLKVDQGRILGEKGTIITEEDKVIEESSVHFGRSIDNHRIFKTLKLPKLTKVNNKDTIAVVTSASPHCYFHWMCDILPKLSILERQNINYDLIYIKNPNLPFQEETLQTLGVDFSKILPAENSAHLECNHLVVPSLPSKVSTVPLWVLSFLKERFLPQDERTETPTKRILISREGASRRRLLNEQDLLKSLQPYGFELVHLEKLTVREQAKLFNECQWIISPHGASLTNLAFCNPNTHVIELFHPKHLGSAYWQMSQQLGLNHHVLLCEPQKTKTYFKTKDNIKDGFAPIDSIIEIIQKESR